MNKIEQMLSQSFYFLTSVWCPQVLWSFALKNFISISDNFDSEDSSHERIIIDRAATIYSENKDKNTYKKYRKLIFQYYGYNKFCFNFRYANFAYEGLTLKLGNM